MNVSTVTDWTSVVTHPLGLWGFALCRVFGVLSLSLKRRTPYWITGCLMVFAAVCLVSGFTLAYRHQEHNMSDSEKKAERTTGGQNEKQPQVPRSVQPSIPSRVHQETHGALQGVEGNVIINQGGSAPKK